MRKIKKGDEIIVTSGKDKGKRGKVLRVLNGTPKLMVEGINLIKAHTKPNPQMNQQGGIVSKEAFIHLSNVAIFNNITGKADKVAAKLLEDGRKVRVYKSNQEMVDI